MTGGLLLALSATAATAADLAKLDALFSRWSTSTPGCAVGAAVKGKTEFARAYGMADLEHEVPNRADSVFEAGSVSKQFTAAAVLLLEREGKLSLEDPVRKHFPELPDYGAPLTIRHLLQHMAGLRDWGAVASIAGWPRGTRTIGHDEVLEILSRQRSLNFVPGSQYSYSNSGYNLAAMLVARVSGLSFAEFSRKQLFEPLGMKSTAWRDDYRRVVKGRAIAYEPQGAQYQQDMPFENVHGNGGLLTTVGDLLIWNEHLSSPRLWDAGFQQRMETPGLFNDGKSGSYAMGLVVGRYRGLREIGHSGSTAGYRAHLLRLPEQGVSVAVLCNAGDAAPTALAHQVAELLLPDASLAPVRPMPAAPARPVALVPTRQELQGLIGRYRSDEAESSFQLALEGEQLVLRQRPGRIVRLQATEQRDQFRAGPLGLLRFERDAEGRATAVHSRTERVWDLVFSRD
ncbi:serine hydrolase domain-containing protein [Pelomonas sp. SE-A7]|uniref:serine hydrolase domain-containing protein n=1 Tax=Pelomonas sp. SE-A7 TaxID=3054953 RepID=UPI00259C6C18|nr:serine hydrolase domain-containing protein [Pelomonas sp. SE-A7]MDM4767747.1 serine hydrolase domain-containing protein [Pelomonas sp. SE-A7]